MKYWRTRAADDPTYDEWRSGVEAELTHYGNVDPSDVSDSLLRECYDQQMTPHDTARHIDERW